MKKSVIKFIKLKNNIQKMKDQYNSIIFYLLVY